MTTTGARRSYGRAPFEGGAPILAVTGRGTDEERDAARRMVLVLAGPDRSGARTVLAALGLDQEQVQ